MAETLLLSVSDIKLYQLCPQLFMYKFVDQVGPATKPVAFEIGTHVHTLLEQKLRGYGITYTAADIINSLPQNKEVRDTLETLIPALRLWEPPHKWEIIDVEKEVRFQVNDEITLVGRLDCVVRAMGKLWHLQHKTIAANKQLSVFEEQMRTDWHEIFYQIAAEKIYGEEFAGTILNCIRKLSARTVASAPQSVFHTAYLGRSGEVLEDGMQDIVRIAEQIGWDITAYGVEVAPIKNRDACGGRFGNSLCPYKPVCDKQLKLEQMNFVRIEPRYEQQRTDS